MVCHWGHYRQNGMCNEKITLDIKTFSDDHYLEQLLETFKIVKNYQMKYANLLLMQTLH